MSQYFFFSTKIRAHFLYSEQRHMWKESIAFTKWHLFGAPSALLLTNHRKQMPIIYQGNFSKASTGASTCGIHIYREIPATGNVDFDVINDSCEIRTGSWVVAGAKREQDTVTEVHGYVWLDENALAADRRRGWEPGTTEVGVHGGARVAKSRLYKRVADGSPSQSRIHRRWTIHRRPPQTYFGPFASFPISTGTKVHIHKHYFTRENFPDTSCEIFTRVIFVSGFLGNLLHLF